MRAVRNLPGELHGVEPVGVSRYLALYVTQVGWLALGAFLLTQAYWPSTCRPHDMLEVYGCSAMLPEGGGWVEAVLTTWLWTTPILVVLEVMRRFKKPRRR